ncbi:hypothetical protein [Streptomyces halstedii]|uniref:hypothetical protein n=1 Tax=Streptomyces halstedii TaxID=1944 RepID=UPI0037F62A7E
MTTTPTPAALLRAAAEKLRAARFSGAITATPTVAALISARLPLAAWLEAEAAPPITAQHSDRCTDPQCTTLAALAVARQLLGTTPVTADDLGPADGQQKTRALARLHASLTPIPEDPAPAVWVDGDPLMEAMATAVYEQCRTEPSIVVDDPRNIAAVAATVARQLLGTTEGDRRCVCGDPIEWMTHPDGSGWIHSPGSETRCLDARPAVPLAEVWTVWREDEPVYAHYTTEDDARQGTIDCWQEDEPSCPDYSWRKDGPRLELMVGGEFGGVYASRHRVYGAPPAPADRATVRDRIRRAICEASGFTWLPDELMEPDEYGEHADAVLAVLDTPADRAATCICGHPEQQHFEDVCQTCDCGDYIEPQDAREVIARWRQAALANRDLRRATTLREGADLIEQALIHSVTPAASERDETWDQAVRAAATELRDVAAGVQPHTTSEALTDAERQFLTFALDRATDEMSLGDGFTDEDEAALEKFRVLATPPAVPAAPEETTWSGATELASDREIARVAATGVVGYRQDQGRLLHCLAHKPAPASRWADFHEVGAEDLDDGGNCAYPRCGRDLLAAWPAAPEETR